MKTNLLFMIHFLIVSFCLAQSKVSNDTISDTLQEKQNIVLRCQASIRNNESPLFIIDGVQMAYNNAVFSEINPDDIVSIEVLEGPFPFGCFGSLSRNGIVLIATKKTKKPFVMPEKNYLFKTYTICNSNWNTTQDLYNSIQAKVPGISISFDAFSNQTPTIKMRGDTNTIVIVDGIRYDTSILTTLNPADIESVEVSNSPVAQNYFLNN